MLTALLLFAARTQDLPMPESVADSPAQSSLSKPQEVDGVTLADTSILTAVSMSPRHPHILVWGQLELKG